MRLAVLLALALPAAAKDRPGSASGVVVQSLVKVAPGDAGPVLREGKLTMTTKAGEQLELKITPKTKVTVDGKPAKYEKSAAPGTGVARALFDPKTKVATVLDLKAAPRKAQGGAEVVRGEVAATDILKNTVSVRVGKDQIRDFDVPETARVRRAAGDAEASAATLDAVRVGDAVEVETSEGKTAVSVSARGPK